MKMLIGLVLLSLLVSVNAFSQTQYTCDFEDSTEVKQWVLNPGNQGPKCKNRWHIGGGSNNGGERGLYISSDGGATDRYVLNADFTVAHRTILLDSGEYELSVDVMVGGNEYDVLYVGWIPASQPTNCNEKGMLPQWVKNYAMVFVDTLQGIHEVAWHTVYGRVESDGTPMKLVFMWANGESGVGIRSASVDNIHIIPEGSCVRPPKIKFAFNAEDVTITWTSTGGTSDFRCRRVGDTTWVEHNGYTDTAVVISGVGEGMYDVYVRNDCGEYKSAWTSKSKFIFYTGKRCVDYLDLEGKNTHCSYGTFDNPDLLPGVIDKGYESSESRHTLHYDPNETDPRTGNLLYTVPDNEIASVRIGNWMKGAEGEMVEYDYYVDLANTAVLMLNYAVVLQNPGHPEDDQPRFDLKIIDKDGFDIGEDGCSGAKFIPGYTTGDEWASVDSLMFLDWSTVGINLSDYAGQNLRIQLIARDCSQSAHFGYAYFTVGCSDGQITALSCGKGDANKFKAPDGFFYRWYREGTPEVTYSKYQSISVPQTDTATYYCEVMQRTNDQCYFLVSAKALPRIPHPDVRLDAKVENCSNVVKCENLSRVIMVNSISNDTIDTGEPVDGVMWDFGDGTTSTEWEPTHTFPNHGGRYTITLSARLANCDEVRTFDIELPNLEQIADTIEAVTCSGEPYKFGDGWYHTEGYYTDTLMSATTQCDSVVVLHLTVNEKYDIEVADTICSADIPYIFGTQSLSESGVYTEVFKTVDGCDSTVHLTLTVNTSLILDLASDHISACADDTLLLLPYTLTSGVVSSFDMTSSDGSLQISGGKTDGENLLITIPAGVTPGQYNVQFLFRNMDCGDVVKDIRFDIDYPDSIVVQRWNDVLGVRNSLYNGGYEFISYQWYVDGSAIVGATSANYYSPDELDINAEYTVLLTRTDGVSAFTCPLKPQYFADIEVEPTILFRNQEVHVRSEVSAYVRVWNSMGMLVDSYRHHGGDSTFRAPSDEGMYLVEVVLSDGIRRIEKIVVKR